MKLRKIFISILTVVSFVSLGSSFLNFKIMNNNASADVIKKEYVTIPKKYRGTWAGKPWIGEQYPWQKQKEFHIDGDSTNYKHGFYTNREYIVHVYKHSIKYHVKNEKQKYLTTYSYKDPGTNGFSKLYNGARIYEFYSEIPDSVYKDANDNDDSTDLLNYFTNSSSYTTISFTHGKAAFDRNVILKKISN